MHKILTTVQMCLQIGVVSFTFFGTYYLSWCHLGAFSMLGTYEQQLDLMRSR